MYAKLGPSLCGRLTLFENRNTRKIFVGRREDITRIKMYSKDVHNLYASPNITVAFKLKGIRWTWHVARMAKI
jgi:hypothetical protein